MLPSHHYELTLLYSRHRTYVRRVYQTRTVQRYLSSCTRPLRNPVRLIHSHLAMWPLFPLLPALTLSQLSTVQATASVPTSLRATAWRTRDTPP